MATTELKAKVSVDLKVTLELSLAEARALNEITTYGSEAFLGVYYTHLGKSSLMPHEKGVKSLFETIKENLPSKLYNADKIIQAVNDIKGLNP